MAVACKLLCAAWRGYLAHQSRAIERVWLKGRPQGELDETKLVDGVAGSSAIYKHRGPKPKGGGAQRRVSLRFVMDLSGSMYTFERLVGITVLRGRSGSIPPPKISMPRASGVTSSRRRSCVSDSKKIKWLRLGSHHHGGLGRDPRTLRGNTAETRNLV